MKLLHIIRAILREIFDESAYDRFCTREGLVADKGSYARFLRQCDPSTRPTVRCC
jgi:hypothetical protein